MRAKIVIQLTVVFLLLSAVGAIGQSVSPSDTNAATTNKPRLEFTEADFADSGTNSTNAPLDLQPVVSPSSTNYSDWVPIASSGATATGTSPLKKIIAVVLTVLLLTALVTFVILARRVMKRLGTGKIILLCGMLSFVLCGLFPPWLDISNQGHTRATAYSFILSPPPTKEYSYGVELDVSRLVVEWLCILAVTAVTWIIFVPKTIKETSKPPVKD